MSAVVRTDQSPLVGMGQIAVIAAPQIARAVLGSCVGIVLYDELRKLAALAHVVLPSSEGRAAGTPGKFADTAIPWMTATLVAQGADPKRIKAKMSGGANMFVGNGPFQIGKQNAEAIHRGLEQAKIRLVAEHLGGNQGRRVTFNIQSAEYLIEIVGQTPLTI